MRYAVLFLLVASAAPVHAQTRATQIAAEFTKTKAQTKTKAGVSTRKYREVRSEVWRVDNVHDYAGRYVSLGHPLILEINFAPAPRVHGSDSERFEIRNPRFVGALLTGTKLYRDGRTEAFEAAFLERSARSSPDDPFVVEFGVGLLVDPPSDTGVTSRAHVFLRRNDSLP